MNTDRSISRFRRRRLVVLATLCLAGLGLLAYTGALAYVPNSMAADALSAHHVDRARDYLEWSQRLASEHPQTEFLLARVSRKQGRLDAMSRHLEKARELGFDRERLRREALLAYAQAGQLDGKYQEMDRLLIDPRGDGQEILDAYVNGLLRNANYVQAGYLVDTWVAEFPEDPQPHYINGRIQRHLRDFAEAEQAFREAIERQPDHYPALYQLGTMLLDQKRPADAIPLLERCLEMRWNAAATLALARCYRAQGDSDAARSLLHDIVSKPREEVAKSFQRVGQPLEGDPAAAELGSLELANGQYDTALKWLTQAVDADPHDLDTRYSWAIALRHDGQVERSVEELQRVFDAREALTEVDRLVDGLDPMQPFVDERFRIGQLYMQHGSKRTAEFWLKSVLHFEPDHQETHRLLAEYYDERAVEDPRYAAFAENHRSMLSSDQ